MFYLVDVVFSGWGVGRMGRKFCQHLEVGNSQLILMDNVLLHLQIIVDVKLRDKRIFQSENDYIHRVSNEFAY